MTFNPIEAIAVAFGIVSVLLSVRENIWSWPTAIVNVTLYIFVFFRARLYADMALQVVYIAISAYGWHEWLHGGRGRAALSVSRGTPRLAAVLVGIGAASSLLIGTLLARHTNAALPYVDSMTTATSLIAQWMMAHKILRGLPRALGDGLPGMEEVFERGPRGIPLGLTVPALAAANRRGPVSSRDKFLAPFAPQEPQHVTDQSVSFWSRPCYTKVPSGVICRVDIATAYDVTLDQAGMDWQQAGPLFERYAVSLVGRVDRRWVDTYTKLAKERPNLSRFRLEPAANQVSFTCRSTDGPAEVMGVLKRLEEMVGLVNEMATAAAKAELDPTKGKAHTAEKSEAPHGPAALAAGLFARLSRR